MDKQRLPSAPKCTNCGHKLDGFTALEDGAKPSDGDLSICAYCGQICKFSDNLTKLVPLTIEDLARLKKTDKKSWDMLKKSQEIVNAMIAKKNIDASDGKMSDGTDIEIRSAR